MDFFNQMQTALRGPTGAPQTAEDTIGRLADRLGPETQPADRRAAVQALRGLVKAHKAQVGQAALAGLLRVLTLDAALDETAARASLDTLGALCAVDDDQTELGLANAGRVLEDEGVVRTLCELVADDAFYTRYGALQLLGALLAAKRAVVQAQFLSAQRGAAALVAILDEKRDVIRNEALAVVQALATESADVQKVLAFEGAFDRLFAILQAENGVDGGLPARDALLCVDLLLRFNSSNQSFFRETPFPPVLCTLLLYPPALPPHEPVPQEFALQFWDAAKTENAVLVVGLIGLLANAKGGSPQEFAAFTRCLLELALGSNAPTSVKARALSLLPTGADLPLPTLSVTAYVPVPGTNGEEWDRLEPASALDVLVELAVLGEYAGQHGARTGRDDLSLRAAALTLFEAFVRKPELKTAILRSMLPADDGMPAPITPLLRALATPPTTPPDATAVAATQLACLLFASLVRSAPDAKALARAIVPPRLDGDASGGAFFVPADNAGAAPPPPPEPEDEDEDEPQALLPLLAEHLALALLQRAKPDTPPPARRACDRLAAGYLALLAQWAWDDAGAVRELLDAGALGVLVEPIHAPGDDALVPGLCAFVLGAAYEFNRAPGAVARATMHPLLARLGVDALAGKLARVREDARFRAVGPEDIVLAAPGGAPDEHEIWFDWAFVDFYKSNYYVVQKGVAVDPDTVSSAASQNQEAAMLAASLREVIANQAHEIERLQARLAAAEAEAAAAKQAAATMPPPPPPPAPVPNAPSEDLAALEKELAALRVSAGDAEARAKETEREQEDLLVLLDELNQKRARDKARMRTAGLEVSEDEDEDDEDGDE